MYSYLSNTLGSRADLKAPSEQLQLSNNQSRTIEYISRIALEDFNAMLVATQTIPALTHLADDLLIQVRQLQDEIVSLKSHVFRQQEFIFNLPAVDSYTRYPIIHNLNRSLTQLDVSVYYKFKAAIGTSTALVIPANKWVNASVLRLSDGSYNTLGHLFIEDSLNQVSLQTLNFVFTYGTIG